MTLDEAIKHCEEVAKRCELHDYELPEQLAYIEKFYDAKKCAEDHRQLAEWLKDYKLLKEKEPYDKCVYSTKDGCCQYDDITETIPPFDPYKDTIYRQVAIDVIEKNACNTQRILDAIKALPSAKPERKTGKWISLDDFRGKYNTCGYKCSECSEHSEYEENFCPNCGADMRGDEQSSANND